MSTVSLTSRLAALEAAITAAAALPPLPNGTLWTNLLKAERAALSAAAAAEKDDAAFQNAAVLWAETLPSVAVLTQTLVANPIYLARGLSGAVLPALATTVVNNPRRSFLWGRTPGSTAEMLERIFHEGHRWWLNQPAARRPLLAEASRPLNDIVVLVPVTIETRFSDPDAAHPFGRVKVRVTPDDISINRHRPQPTSLEVQLVRDLRTKADAKGLKLGTFLTADADGRALWLKLSDAVRPARAAWLVQQLGEKDLDAVTPDDTDAPAQVDGFPEQIEVWVVMAGNAAAQRIGVGSPVLNDELLFELPRDDADAWWNAWQGTTNAAGVVGKKGAVDLGLGIECDLPGPAEQIDALYVLGVSKQDPGPFFADRVAAGDFAAIEPGTPTNTIHGDPVVDLATDPETWQRIVAAGAGGSPSRTLPHSAALTGKDETLGDFPAPDFDLDLFGQLFIDLLYPALWGHALKDIWGFGANAHGALAWMRAWVRPAGHLLPIRVRDLPYGLAPTTSLDLWQLSEFEKQSSEMQATQVGLVEPRLVPALRTLRHDFAARARTNGTTVDAGTEKLVSLIGRTPTASGYSYQTFIAAELLTTLMAAFGGKFDAARQAAFQNSIEHRYAPGRTVRQRDPTRFYLATGDLRDIGMPLILPNLFHGLDPEKSRELPLDKRVNLFRDLLERLNGFRKVDQADLKERLAGVLSDSLLFRLLLHSSLQARGDAARAGLPAGTFPAGGDGSRLEPITSENRPLLWQWAEQMNLLSTAPVNLQTPAGTTFFRVRDGVERLSKILQEGLNEAGAAGNLDALRALIGRLERVFKNTLDTATTRIDPFAAAIAWRRLQTLRAEPTTRHRLGIYGWVDAPKRGQAGPKPGGLLHAPSKTQAITSIILRDRFLAERSFDGGAGAAWEMNITSQRVRMAEELAEEVRQGAHIYEALGRRVEAIIGDPVLVREFREKLAPQREGQPDRFAVCNGEKVLRLLAEGELPGGVTAAQMAQLGAWAQAVDVYADLLVAQGVQQSVTRRNSAASGTMNAAAGFSLPTELSVIQTPRSGQNVLSTLLAVLPFVKTPAVPPGLKEQAHPVALADASVAAFIDARFGPASDWEWSFHFQGQGIAADGSVVKVDELRNVTLTDLLLFPSDALLFPPDKLALAAGQFARDQAIAGLTETETVQLEAALPPVAAAQQHRLLREVVMALGGRPFEFSQLHLPDPAGASVERDQQDEQIRLDLLERLSRLVEAGKALLTTLADPARAREGWLLALRWGIAPIDRTAAVEDRAALALAALSIRVQAAESFLEEAINGVGALNPAGQSERTAVREIAETINRLAAPEGQLAILSRVETAKLRDYEPSRPILTAPHLDTEWLTVLAPVRTRLARIESLQLLSLQNPPSPFQGFVAYANRPDDPWQKQAVEENRNLLLAGRALQPPRLLAVYGTANAWDGPLIAAGSVDSWSETVPEPRHTTQAAFHFNAPGARAPQAVLLAVPPVLDRLLDLPTLLSIVRETRDSAHARMAALEDLKDYDAVLPLSLLSAPAPWQSAVLNDNTTITF
jgi:hypothetical protein